MAKAPRHTEIAAQSHVASMLARHKWLPAQADYLGVRANNFDLFAAKRNKRITIQVKGSSLEHGRHIQLGYNNAAKEFINKRQGTKADFVIGVIVYTDTKKPCVAYILPAAAADRLARRHAVKHENTPKRDGTTRSKHFPIYLPVANLERYREAWRLLDSRKIRRR
jgi:hypothetical protein